MFDAKKNVTKLWVEQPANKGNASLKTEQYRRKDKAKRLRYGLALSTNNFSHIARSIPIIRKQKCTVSYLVSSLSAWRKLLLGYSGNLPFWGEHERLIRTKAALHSSIAVVGWRLSSWLVLGRLLRDLEKVSFVNIRKSNIRNRLYFITNQSVLLKYKFQVNCNFYNCNISGCHYYILYSSVEMAQGNYLHEEFTVNYRDFL